MKGDLMKYLATAALALTLGACAHDCKCADVEAVDVETMDILEVAAEVPEAEEVVVEEVVVEEVVVETVEAAPVVEEVAIVEEVVEAPVLQIETAPAEVTTSGTARRVVTRRLVDEFDAGTPTAPAMDGSAADDELLSETPRVLEDTTFDTSSVPDTDGE